MEMIIAALIPRPATFRLRVPLGLLFTLFTAAPSLAQAPVLGRVEIAALGGSEQVRFLVAHNAARKAVGTEPLAWSDDLSRDALAWLGEEKDRLIDNAKAGWPEVKTVMPEHRQDGQYGENIAGWAGARVPTAERAVTYWLTEKKAFEKLNEGGDFTYGDQEGKTLTDAQGKERPVVIGHYTAMVWKTTTHLGAAKLVFQLADDRGRKITYVAIFCNYAPRGNIRGEKPF